MPDEQPSSLNTDDLCFWVTELRAGRPNAAEPTFKKIVAKVEAFAAAMFKKFPRVGRFVDLDDVVQNSLMRLIAALRDVRPTSRKHFYALANEQIRRELLDLVKHYFGPRGHGTNLGPAVVGEGEGEVAPVAPELELELERAAAFHKAVEELPAEEREVVGLIYYHDWPRAEVANLFGVSARTVRRWFDAAMAKVRARVGGA
ncbi:MAG: sigma-70 family RNA polymerase sigma factor [Planctomycetes bacterium]|nr:sigma-70 family RNA polymerase sigma factor [Planctomycetota bacterium]